MDLCIVYFVYGYTCSEHECRIIETRVPKEKGLATSE